jgi:malate dehydrogenase
MEAIPLIGCDKKITGTNDFSEIKDSDIVIITAGCARKPGMDREDLINTNVGIMKSVCADIKKFAPKAIIIVVTNPLDIMSYAALKFTGFDKKRVIGMAGVLDTSRLRAFASGELNVPGKEIAALVLGAHGDSMVPVLGEIKVKGKEIIKVLDKEKVDQLIERTRKGGGEFLPLLKTTAWVAPGFSIAKMVEAIVNDSKEVLPASVYLEGEYGYEGIFLGVPVKLGKNGVEEIVEIALNEEAKKGLDNSAKITKNNIKVLK